MKRIKSQLIFLVLLTGMVQGQQLVDGIAAIVGQEIILKSEVEQYVQSYVLQNKLNIMSNPEKYKALQKDVLERLVEQKILLTKADEDTITVTDREIDRAHNDSGRLDSRFSEWRSRHPEGWGRGGGE